MPLFARHLAEVQQRYRSLSPRQLRHETIRRMINALVGDLGAHSAARLAEAAPVDIEAVRQQPAPLVTFSEAMQRENRELKQFLRLNLYQHHQVYRVMTKAQRVVRELFGALYADPRLLPPEAHAEARVAEQLHGTRGRARIVADYVAGMTDRYAIDEHERLFDPRRLR